MKMGHYGMKLDEGSTEDKWTAMNSLRGSWNISTHIARDSWPVGGEGSVIDEERLREYDGPEAALT